MFTCENINIMISMILAIAYMMNILNVNSTNFNSVNVPILIIMIIIISVNPPQSGDLCPALIGCGQCVNQHFG